MGYMYCDKQYMLQPTFLLPFTEAELASQVCPCMQDDTHAHNTHACSSTGTAAYLHALIASLQPDLTQVCPPQVGAPLLALVQLLLGCCPALLLPCLHRLHTGSA